MRLFYKQDGVISIFLILVLVPMITITSIFVDASKVQLSRAVAESAGDLTLNTALAQYDSDLSEYYGLMASCQNIDEFLNVSEDYFKACIMSQGVDANSATEYADQIMGYLEGNNEMSDMLGMDVESGSFSFSKVTNGALNNPALVKSQIVEFMKYRSPINGVASFFDVLQNGKDSVDNMADEAEMTEDKKAFYEAENDLLQRLYDIYLKVLEYNDLKITDTYVTEMVNNIKDTFKEDYKSMNQKYLMDIRGEKMAEMYQIVSSEKVTLYNENKLATYSEVTQQLEIVAAYVSAYYTAKTNFAGFMDTVKEPSGSWSMQYWQDAYDKIHSDTRCIDFKNKATFLNYELRKLENMLAYNNFDETTVKYTLTKYENFDYSKEDTVSHIYGALYTEYNSKIQKHKEFQDLYLLIKDLNDIYSNANRKGNYTFKPDNSYKKDAITTRVKEISDLLKGYVSKIESAKSVLDEIVGLIDGDGLFVEPLNDLIEDYNNKLDDWEDSANKDNLDDSKLAETDREEIEDLKNKNDVNITKNDVKNFKKRVNNIVEFFEKYETGINEEYKFDGELIKKIDTYDKFIKNMNISSDYFEMDEYTLRVDANNRFKTAFKDIKDLIKLKDNGSNNPNFEVKSPDLYLYMKNKFPEDKGSEEKKDEGQADFDEWENKGDDTGDDSQDDAVLGVDQPEISEKTGLPSGDTLEGWENVEITNSLEKVTDFISGLFTDLPDTLNGTVDEVRDNIYVTDYIMNMFSYDTFENEGKYNLAMDAGKEFTYATHAATYQEFDETWKSEDTTVTVNKTLTNKMINSDLCYSYGNEVEYILYGGTNLGNKAKAYGTIYMIRYGFNLAPIFKVYWNNGAVSSLAFTISTATYGIIPEPLVKMVICLALCAAESAIDLMYLKAGFGVNLIKIDKDDLFVVFSSDDIKSEDSKNKTIIDDLNAFQYSDYLTLFLFLGLLSDENANQYYLRTADVIQVNMAKKLDSDSYALKNAQVYFELKTNIEVKPMLLGLPINHDENGNLYDISSWNTFEYSAIRGY